MVDFSFQSSRLWLGKSIEVSLVGPVSLNGRSGLKCRAGAGKDLPTPVSRVEGLEEEPVARFGAHPSKYRIAQVLGGLSTFSALQSILGASQRFDTSAADLELRWGFPPPLVCPSSSGSFCELV